MKGQINTQQVKEQEKMPIKPNKIGGDREST